VRRSLPVLAVVACSAGCQAFGDLVVALAEVARAILIALAFGFTAAYIALAIGFVAALRAALRAGDPASPVHPWLWAAAMLALHLAAVAGFSRAHFGEGPFADRLLLAAGAPLVVLLAAAVLAARRGAFWPLIPGLAALAVYVAFVVQREPPAPPLDELPGRIVELAGDERAACARLSTGQVVCDGDSPKLIAGIDDATAIRIAGPLGCALHSAHPPACWGGGPSLSPRPPDGLWPLPGAADAVELAVADDRIVWRDRAGALHGWPDPPPDALPRARMLVGDDHGGDAWLCLLDEPGALVCWPEDGGDNPRIRRFEAPPAVALAVDAAAEIACTADAQGTVRCFDLDDARPQRTLDVPGLRQLVAVDDGGTFCALGERRVTCWHGDGPARAVDGLADVDEIFAGAGRARAAATTAPRRRSPRSRSPRP
jgi:hypothetical protein